MTRPTTIVTSMKKEMDARDPVIEYMGLDTLTSGGMISVTEEVAGSRYIVAKGGTNSWKTIKTDVPHRAGNWWVELLDGSSSNIHVGAVFQKRGADAPLPVLFKLSSTWLGDSAGISDRSCLSSASFDPLCASPYLVWHAGVERKIAPIGVAVVPAPSGTKLGFTWDPAIGVIYLSVNGKRLGIFMSGLRGWDVYPAVSFHYAPNSVRFSFNTPLLEVAY